MNAQELKKKLSKLGCSFENHKGGSGHLTIRKAGRTSQLPMHGSHKEIGKRLLHKILKDLDVTL